MDRTPRSASAHQQSKNTSIKYASLWAIALAATSVIFLPEVAIGGDQFRYRPGLRISPGVKALNEKQIKTIVKSLREKTGFAELDFDEAGFLTIGDRSNFSGGSASARELMIATMDMKKVVELESCPRSLSVSFARIANQTSYENRSTGAKIESWTIQIDFTDFSLLYGDKQALAAFDPGFVIIHELGHAVLGLHDSYANPPGDCEEMVNRIRRELDLPERQTYIAQIYPLPTSHSSARNGVAQLIFRSNFGDSRQEFRLGWEASRVGRILDQTAISPAKPRNPKTATSIPGQ